MPNSSSARLALAAATALLWPAALPKPTQAAPPDAESFLIEGKLAEGITALSAHLKAQPDDDQARFGLGVLQFVKAVEGRIQAFYRHGLSPQAASGFLPVTNLPVPTNPKPEPIDAAKARQLLQTWVDELAAVETTLAGIKSADVKLPLHFARIRLDFDGDGKAAEEETLWRIYARFNRPANLSREEMESFVIGFDRGDVDWLRGYCHLLSAMAEFLLAHDFSEFFRQSGYLIFTGAPIPQKFVLEEAIAAGRAGRSSPFDFGRIADLVAVIHRFSFQVIEPKRMTAVLEHLEATARLSRSSWKAILAETDNDHEWVPNPKQESVMPNGRVNPAMIDGWMSFLDEFESILAGKTLIPFWRGTNPLRGVNLRKAFTEPRPFDLVLWVQGAAAEPYLEEGRVSQGATWNRLNRIFRGEFIGFALWFN